MAMVSSSLLKVRNLAVTFSGEDSPVHAVDGVSFTVDAGRTLGLVGESGSGKSMTALTIIGLHPAGARVSVRGDVQFEDQHLLALDEPSLQRLRGARIGMIFQEPSTCLNPLMTAGAQIEEALITHTRLDRAHRQSRVEDLFIEAGLRDVERFFQAFPHELSGGEQQRVMIAMALACDPLLLLADEPTTALDVTIQAQILDLLKDLQERRNMAMLFISHDLGVIAKLAHDVAVMRHGRVVETGPCTEVFSKPEHPYTQALLACRPRLDHVLHRLPTLASIERGMDTSARESPRKRQHGTNVLTIRDLAVTYRSRRILARPVLALKGVNLDLGQGSTLGIVGESGSGKSTIAKAVMGLAPIGDGTVQLFGEPIPTNRPLVLQRRCQMIFQDSAGALNPRHRIKRLIGEPLDIHGLHAGASRRPFLEGLIQEVGMEPAHLDRYPAELSGGQRQRVNIARALALDPEILICDEITSALDVSIQAQILNLLKDIQAARDLSLLFISHDIAVVRFMADDILVMRGGEVVEQAPAADLIERPTDDYTKALLDAVPT